MQRTTESWFSSGADNVQHTDKVGSDTLQGPGFTKTRQVCMARQSSMHSLFLSEENLYRLIDLLCSASCVRSFLEQQVVVAHTTHHLLPVHSLCPKNGKGLPSTVSAPCLNVACLRSTCQDNSNMPDKSCTRSCIQLRVTTELSAACKSMDTAACSTVSDPYILQCAL